MINLIINGITKTLFNTFGNRYKIYVENIKQGLQEPCFIVSSIENSIKPFLGKRAKLTNSYQIIYIPKESDKIKEMNEIASKLLTMDFIELENGDKLLARNKRTEIYEDGTGDILRFYAEYNMVINSADSKTYMQELKTGTSVKER